MIFEIAYSEMTTHSLYILSYIEHKMMQNKMYEHKQKEKTGKECCRDIHCMRKFCDLSL